MKSSNALLGILNALTTVISLAVVAAGIWLLTRHDNDCARLAAWPVTGLGIFILLVSLAGLVGAFARSKFLLVLYIVVVFLVFLALLAFTIFAIVVTNKGAGEAVSGRGFKEYRLGDYNSWLQRHVVGKPAYWRRIKSCLIRSEVCTHLQDDNKGISLSSFYQKNLSPIQSGCCKPPLACNFTFVNATTWVNASNISANNDCKEWSNDDNQLCFNCQSCKAGVLQELKRDWKWIAITNGVILFILILLLCLGCCSISNGRRHYYQQAPQGFLVKA